MSLLWKNIIGAKETKIMAIQSKKPNILIPSLIFGFGEKTINKRLPVPTIVAQNHAWP